MGIKAKGCCADRLVPDSCCPIPDVPDADTESESSDFASLAGFNTFLMGAGGTAVALAGEAVLTVIAGVGSNVQIARTSDWVNPTEHSWCLCARIRVDDVESIATKRFGLRRSTIALSTKPGVFIELISGAVRIVVIDLFEITFSSGLLLIADGYREFKLCYDALTQDLTLRIDGVLAITFPAGVAFLNLNAPLPVSFDVGSVDTLEPTNDGELHADSYCASRVAPPCACDEDGQPVGFNFHEDFSNPVLPGWLQTALGPGATTVLGSPVGVAVALTAFAGAGSSAIQIRNASASINPHLDDFCLCMRFSVPIIGTGDAAFGGLSYGGAGLRDPIVATGGVGGPGIAIARVKTVESGDLFEMLLWDGAGNVVDIGLMAGDAATHDWKLCIIGDTVTLRKDGVIVPLPPFVATRAALIAFGSIPNAAIPASAFADVGSAVDLGTRIIIDDYCANWNEAVIPCSIPNVPDLQTTVFLDDFDVPALPQWNVTSGVPSVVGGHLLLNVVDPASPQIVLFGATPFNVNPEKDDWCVCNTARYVTPQAGSAQLLGIANAMNGAVDLVLDAQFPINFQLLVTNSVGNSHLYDTGIAVAPFINAHHDYRLCHVSGTQIVDIYIDGFPMASINTNVVGLDPVLTLTSHIAAFNQFSVVSMVFDIAKSSARDRPPPA
jgi:hypothetical protein